MYKLVIENNRVVNKSATENIHYIDERYIDKLIFGYFKTFNGFDKSKLIDSILKQNPEDVDVEKLSNKAEFSFSIVHNDRLYLYRDCSASQKLYFSNADGKITISNSQYEVVKELKERKLSTIGVYSFLVHEYVLEPYSFFNNVFAVEKGNVLYANLSEMNNIEMKKIFEYGKLSLIEENDFSIDENIKILKELIIKAHEKRVGRNNGVLLSGGIDSCVSASVLKREIGVDDLESFTFTTKGALQSEWKEAKLCADRLGVNFNLLEVDPSDEFDIETTTSSNYPYFASALLSPLMKQAADKIGDTGFIFAGQDTRIHTPHVHYIDRVLISFVGKVNLNGIPSVAGHKKIVKVIDRLKSLTSYEEYTLNNLLHKHRKTKITGINSCEVNLLNNISSKFNKNKNLTLREFYNSMVDITIGHQHCSDNEYVNNCARKHGLYAQMPYFDWELIRFSASIPFEMRAKITSGRAGHSNKKKNVDKYLLRKAFEPYLPNELVYRDKAVCITNHDFLNKCMSPFVLNCEIKGFEENLDDILKYAKSNNGKWDVSNYEDVVEIQNIIFLNEIQNNYCNGF